MGRLLRAFFLYLFRIMLLHCGCSYDETFFVVACVRARLLRERFLSVFLVFWLRDDWQYRSEESDEKVINKFNYLSYTCQRIYYHRTH